MTSPLRLPTLAELPTRLAAALLGLSLLFMIQAYFGIDHDSVLYLGEVLRLRMPHVLDQDLYFAHGSQGRYTLFPHLVLLLSQGASLPTLFVWGAALGLLAFAAANWQALRVLLPAGERYLPWLALLCLPTVYGAFRIFGYAEPFFTPRPWAEALCLLALALITRHRLALAGLCLLLAGLLHPLQTLGAAFIFWVYLALEERRWLRALWLVPLALLLGLAGVAPFDGLLRPLDTATFGLSYQFSRHLYVTGWRLQDFQTLTFDLLILLHASRTLALPLRRWSLAALLTVPLTLALSALLADGWHLTLPAGLQLWRTHWLAHWLAMALVGVRVQQALAARAWPPLVLLALAVTLGYGQADWYWLPALLLYMAWPHLQLRLRPQVQRLLTLACVLVIAVFFLDYIGNAHAAFVKAHYQLAKIPFDRAFLTFPALSLSLALAGIWAWRRSRWQMRGGLLLLLFTFSAYAGLRWDSRPALYKALEGHPFTPDLFGVTLPAHAQVYWDRASSVANWLVINRPDYYSPQQLSGLVFSPGTAADARARMARLRPLQLDAQRCLDETQPEEVRRRCRMSDAALRAACSLARPPAPDYLVLPYRQDVPALGQWTVHLDLIEEPTRIYWLYSCQIIRERLGHPSPATGSTLDRSPAAHD